MEKIPVRKLPVSKMAEDLIGSEIIKLAGEVKTRIAAGDQIYNLTIGDFDPKIFSIPQAYLNEIIKAYQAGETNYPVANGMQLLRESISNFIGHRGGLDYKPGEILVSSGARPLIYAAYTCLIDPGDKIVYPVPSWNNNHYTHLSRAEGIFVQTRPENNFMPDPEAVQPHLKGASMLALCSPLNPTGTTFDPDTLGRICDMVLEENNSRPEGAKPLYVLYDQIYWNLTYGENHHIDPVSLRPDMRDYTLFIDGMSKAFAATGVRVGWGFGPSSIIGKMKSILSHVGAWSPRAEQIATARYLAMEDQVTADIDHMREGLQARLEEFYKGFASLKEEGYPVSAISPQAALYLTVRFDLVGKTTMSGEYLDSMKAVTSFLLEEAGVAMVPFYAFGSPKDSPWYRLSVGTTKMEDIDKIIAGIRRALALLN